LPAAPQPAPGDYRTGPPGSCGLPATGWRALATPSAPARSLHSTPTTTARSYCPRLSTTATRSGPDRRPNSAASYLILQRHAPEYSVGAVPTSSDLAPCCRVGGNAPLNGTDVLPVRGTRHLSTSALPSTLRCALDVLVKEPPDAASGTTAAASRSTRTSSTSGHNRTRHADVTGGRNARAGSWRARRMGTAGVIRHLPAGPEPGRPGLSSPPPRLGREAGDARQR
jgi:hypothetical protein